MGYRVAAMLATGLMAAVAVFAPAADAGATPLAPGAAADCVNASPEQVATLKKERAPAGSQPGDCFRWVSKGGIETVSIVSGKRSTAPKRPVEPVYTTDPNSNTEIAKFMPAPGKQGATGTCTAWSIGYGMAGYYLRKQGDTRFGNPFHLHAGALEDWLSTREAPGGGVHSISAHPIDVYEEAVSDGVSVDGSGAVSEPIVQLARLLPPVWLRGNGVVSTDEELASSIVLHVNAGHPVSVSVMFGSELTAMWAQGADFMEYVAPTGDDYFHEVLIIGYDSRGFLIQNSWGPHWSGDGRAWMSWSMLPLTTLLT